MSGTTPTTLGKYQIIREIARSNDIVYEAYDPLMNRRIALKELAMPSGASDAQRDDRIRRFSREAKAAGSLNHPNIVTIFEFGEDSGRHFIAMEFLEGHNLRNELDTHGFLAADRAIEITLEVLDALDYAHKNGVIHRDIKPENIQLLPDGRVKLTDFGIARITFEPNLTIDGQVFGTPSYMSPEQVVGREIDARSDVFGVGVILYEMLSGQKPFQGDSVVSITYGIVNSEPSQPPQANHAVWQVLTKALDKSPALRFATAHDMHRALESAKSASRSQVIDYDLQLYGGSGTSYSPPQPAAPPIGNPYVGTPYGNPYMPAPQQHPYNPYQPGTPPITQSPHGLPPGQIPVYYPPPPRAPLISPETKQFLGKMMLTLIVLGTLFALVIAIIQGLGTLIDRMQTQAADLPMRERMAGQDPNVPLHERIAEREKIIPELKSEVNRRTEERNVAKLYETQGREYVRVGNLVAAEQAFRSAIANDPQNPTYYRLLGSLFSQTAVQEMDIEQRMNLWKQSIRNWEFALTFETNEAIRKDSAALLASACYRLANDYLNLGQEAEARSLLYSGREVADPSSEVSVAIQGLLDRLTRPDDSNP